MVSALQYTPVDKIEGIRDELRAGFASGKLESIAYRKYQITQLIYLIKDNMTRFEEALKKDLNKPVLEARMLDLVPSVTEAVEQLKGIDEWTKSAKPAFNLSFFAMRPSVRKEAKGTVLIISPFNYPVWLTLGPLAGAIAAGNTTLLKPSELTPATSALMTELVGKYLDTDIVRVVNGAIPETTKLLDLQWDHILYTGNPRVARIVATAAAKHLTPITLELGGKSPVIVDPGCDLKTTARRILWGKVINAGQTCVAPDYILVPREFQDKLCDALKDVYEEFYPDGVSSPDTYSRLISEQATERISRLLASTKGKIVFGGEVDKKNKFVAPTLVRDVKHDDPLMQEEIFGPLFPVVPVDNIDAAIKFVNEREHPLAIYVFSRDEKVKAKVSNQTQSGGVIANETIIHIAIDGVPFGGIGPSGYGHHTGKYTFDMFTHLRTTIDSPSWIDYILKFRFPPYTASNQAQPLRLLAAVPARPKGPPTTADSSYLNKWLVLAFALTVAGGVASRLKIASS